MSTGREALTPTNSSVLLPTMEHDSWSSLMKKYDYYIRTELEIEICLREALLQVIHNDEGDPTYIGLPRDKKLLFQKLLRFKMNKERQLKKKVYKDQWDIMCPISGETHSESFDVTTELVVIRHEVPLPPPSIAWTSSEVLNPTNKADFCILARILRNKVKHMTIMDISTKPQFDQSSTAIETVLNGLSYKNMMLFQQLKTGPIEPYINKIILLLQKKIVDAEEKLKELEQRVGTNEIAIILTVEENQTGINDLQMEIKNLSCILQVYQEWFKEDLNKISSEIDDANKAIALINDELLNLQTTFQIAKQQRAKLSEDMAQTKANAKQANIQVKVAKDYAEKLIYASLRQADEAKTTAIAAKGTADNAVDEMNKTRIETRQKIDEARQVAEEAKEKADVLNEKVEKLRCDLTAAIEFQKQAKEKVNAASKAAIGAKEKFMQETVGEAYRKATVANIKSDMAIQTADATKKDLEELKATYISSRTELLPYMGGGSEVELIESLPERYRCEICNKLLKDPVQTYLGRRACSFCYHAAKGNSKTCPIDHEPIEDNQIFKDKVALRDIEQLSCYCVNKIHGCTWKGKIKNLQAHEKTCMETLKLRENMDQVEEISLINLNLSDLDLKLQLLENTSYNGKMLWKIDNIHHRMQQAIAGEVTALHSAPCYTKRGGYKFCTRLYLNGDGTGRGTHISLFFVIMKSEFDALLAWPFRNRVTFRMVNLSNQKSKVESFLPDKKSSSFQKPTRNMNVAAGYPMFISKEKLMSKEYIVDDTLFIGTVVAPTAGRLQLQDNALTNMLRRR